MLAVVTLCAFGAAYCLGGLHGLWLAWSQPSRMRHWARMVDLTTDRWMALRAEIELEKFERRNPSVKADAP